MAKFILRDCFTSVNGVNLSDHASSVEINQEYDDVDLTAFTSASKEHGVGIADASITINWYQDFAAASVDATLSPIFAAKTPVPIVVRPTQAAVSTTNPQYTMQGVMLSYSPLNGSVGDASQTETEFVNGAGAGIVRTTA